MINYLHDFRCVFESDAEIGVEKEAIQAKTDESCWKVFYHSQHDNEEDERDKTSSENNR